MSSRVSKGDAVVGHIVAGDEAATRDAFRAHRERAADELLGILDDYQLGRL